MATQDTASHTAAPTESLASIGAVDTHVHVFDPQRFGYTPDRAYSPGPATVEQLRAHLDDLGVGRVVVVQPSAYGTDNTCTLRSVAELGERARAVVVIDPRSTTTTELDALRERGAVGIRVNLAVRGESRAGAALAELGAAFSVAAPVGLPVHLHLGADLIGDLGGAIADAPVPVVLDHFGGIRADKGLSQPALTALLSLLGSGRVWVKLSAPSRVSSRPDHDDLAPIAAAMIGANPARMLWGSDWPHTGGGADRAQRDTREIEPFRHIDDHADLRRLSRWTGDADTLAALLADNASALYGF